MRKFNTLILILFFFSIPILGKEYNWGKDYKIIIKPVSTFVSEIIVKETSTNNVIHESLSGMHYVLKTKRKIIAGLDLFFIQATTGGEGMVSSNLYYFYIENKNLMQGAVEDIIDFSLLDLDGDKNKELILFDFKYYKFKVNNCYNALEPDPHYTGKLLPTIYKFSQKKFVKVNQDIPLLKKYISKLQKKLPKKKKYKNLNGYAYFLAISKKTGMEKEALEFIKQNNSDFTYECENTNSQNPKGKSFQLKTNYHSFFQKYLNNIP